MGLNIVSIASCYGHFLNNVLRLDSAWQDFIIYQCFNLPLYPRGHGTTFKRYVLSSNTVLNRAFHYFECRKTIISECFPMTYIVVNVLKRYGIFPPSTDFHEIVPENYYCDYFMPWLQRPMSISSFTGLIYWHWSGTSVKSRISWEEILALQKPDCP